MLSSYVLDQTWIFSGIAAQQNPSAEPLARQICGTPNRRKTASKIF
jgi:hypothetical protein